ncbi:4'-phosphopantetheinyl transferase family protein [Microbacterium oxydans]|uniref:4'-phosphopantetheinyl transferase domain-containing protein n=1 Tax=Microbacterium oxydans TaxID=82380 RepID=A0A0F0LA90_9MICO|nr:hypothetical protein [Microbacterium oxydans]KJL29175.1 hypothetical protein RS83_01801 [Microbacterium oxydans]
MGEITWRGAMIAWAHTSAFDVAEADLAAMGERQLARYRQLDGARASGFLAGRALIRELVLRLGGGPVVHLDSACERCGDDHAAPRIDGFMISVSHAGDLVAVAVAPGMDPLGVDVEADADRTRVAELGPMFAPVSAPDLAGWTRIEAAVKADGRGFAIDPRDVRLEPQPQHEGSPMQAPPTWLADVPDRTSRLQVATLPGPTGYTLSVARG